MAPAQQRLGAADGAVAHVDLGLEMQLELVAVQRGLDVAAQRVALLQAGTQFVAVDAHLGAAGGLAAYMAASA